jgi:hypothetical protein
MSPFHSTTTYTELAKEAKAEERKSQPAPAVFGMMPKEYLEALTPESQSLTFAARTGQLAVATDAPTVNLNSPLHQQVLVILHHYRVTSFKQVAKLTTQEPKVLLPVSVLVLAFNCCELMRCLLFFRAFGMLFAQHPVRPTNVHRRNGFATTSYLPDERPPEQAGGVVDGSMLLQQHSICPTIVHREQAGCVVESSMVLQRHRSPSPCASSHMYSSLDTYVLYSLQHERRDVYIICLSFGVLLAMYSF